MIFCLIYIIIGVPLTIIILESIVERLEQKIGYKKFKLKRTLFLQAANGHSSSQQNGVNSAIQSEIQRKFYFKVFLLGICWLVSVYLIPSFIFANITELNWSLIDAFYYCFISITTIGFGDFVPGQSQVGYERNIYRLLMTVYLILGIILNSLFLNMFIKIPLVDKFANIINQRFGNGYLRLDSNSSRTSIDELQDSSK
jgi:potassium channel subfamily K protein 1